MRECGPCGHSGQGVGPWDWPRDFQSWSIRTTLGEEPYHPESKGSPPLPLLVTNTPARPRAPVGHWGEGQRQPGQGGRGRPVGDEESMEGKALRCRPPHPRGSGSHDGRRFALLCWGTPHPVTASTRPPLVARQCAGPSLPPLAVCSPTPRSVSGKRGGRLAALYRSRLHLCSRHGEP